MLKLGTHIKCLALLLLLSFSAWGQGWEQSYGGSARDAASDILPAADGGFYLLGNTASYGNGDQDFFLVKTGPNGELEWSANIGDSTWAEYGQSIQYTSDGGLLLAGTAIQEHKPRIQIVKTDLQGNIFWINRSSEDSVAARSVVELSSGEFLVSGSHTIKRTDTNGITYIDNDVYLYKINATGTELSGTTYGGIRPEDGFAVLEKNPGTALVAGYTRSFGNGGYDVYLLEVDTDQDTLINSYTFGTPSEDLGYALSATNDGGFVIAGQQDINDASSENFFLLKLDSNLQEEWLNPFSINGLETARAVTQTTSGAYLLAGEIRNSTSSNRDPFVIKADPSGNIIWSKRFGGLLGDGAASIENCPDEAFAIAGYTFSYGAGNSDAYLIKSDSTGIAFSNVVHGNVYTDLDLDCMLDNAETGIPGWTLSATGNILRHTLTDSLGNYQFHLDTGAYEIQLYPPNSYWEPCAPIQNVNLTWSFDSVQVDFPVQPEVDCPLLSVNLSTPFLRRCFPNVYTVQYCNSGTALAPDAYIEVSFDEHFQIDSTSIPATNDGSTYTFQVGDVDLFECGSFKIYTTLDSACNSTILGQTHCVEAHIYPDSICQPIDPLWDGSSIEVDANCNGDSLFFTITNVGQGDMTQVLDYVIIEDHIMLFTGGFNLISLQDTTFGVQVTGSTFSFNAEQSEGHPGESRPSISVEGCGGEPFSTGYVIQLPQNDGNPFIDIDCQENIGSFDPNDKKAFPKGYEASHFIEANTDIEYLIRFQNTGTDTAFRVIIRDTLSPALDITKIETGVGSHPYTFSIYDERVLKFTFDNIQLPDSSVNEPASHGFIKFRVAQIEDNPNGTYIYNKAGIYFDYNKPIITNETFHLVGENFILIDTIDTGLRPIIDPTNIKFYPNPFTDHITFEFENLQTSSAQPLSFSLYDMQGRQIRKEFYQGHSFTFFRKDLANGLYLFRIENQDGLIGTGKLVIGH